MNYRRSIEVENLSHSSAACGVMYMYGWESHSYQKEKFPLEALKISFRCILRDQLKNKNNLAMYVVPLFTHMCFIFHHKHRLFLLNKFVEKKTLIYSHLKKSFSVSSRYFCSNI